MNRLTNAQIIKRLERPSKDQKVNLIIDTDTFNEIDDQFAVAYAVKSPERINLLGIHAAPFANDKADNPKLGMEKSYNEILNLLNLMDETRLNSIVKKGATAYLPDEKTPVHSEAVDDLIEKAMSMKDGELLYVATIGAITNIASAILIEPRIIEKIVVVWLGGNAHHHGDTWEFNLMQDVAAVRVVFDSTVPVVQMPCFGVTTNVATTEPELRHYLKGKNKLCDYLYEITCKEAINGNMGRCWAKVIWDIVTIAWLIGNDDNMNEVITHSPIVTYEKTYSFDMRRHFMKYINHMNRDVIFDELFEVLTK